MPILLTSQEVEGVLLLARRLDSAAHGCQGAGRALTNTRSRLAWTGVAADAARDQIATVAQRLDRGALGLSLLALQVGAQANLLAREWDRRRHCEQAVLNGLGRLAAEPGALVSEAQHAVHTVLGWRPPPWPATGHEVWDRLHQVLTRRFL